MKRKTIFLLLLLSISLLIGYFIVNKEYNKPENIKKRAIKYCINNKYEFREVINSNGQKEEFCIVDGVKNKVVEFYLNINN